VIRSFAAGDNFLPDTRIAAGGTRTPDIASSSCSLGVACQGLGVVARYKGFRYPIEVFGHAVWLYHCFALSLRDVEQLMSARGVVVNYRNHPLVVCQVRGELR
jgi:hypothetical protein